MTTPQPKLNWAPRIVPDWLLAAVLIMVRRMTHLDRWAAAARDPRGGYVHQPVKTAVASLLVTVAHYTTALVTIIDQVQQGLPPTYQAALGIKPHGAPTRMQREDVDYTSPNPKVNWHESPRYTKPQEGLNRLFSNLGDAVCYSEYHSSELPDREREAHRALQPLVLDDVVGGWFPPLPLPLALTVDATGIRAFSRPRKDPDFDWVYQTPTGRDDVDKIWGAYGCVLAGVNPRGHYPYPAVVLSFRLPLPHEGHNLDLVALDSIDAWLSRGGTGLPVVSDSLYPNKQRWSYNLAQRGCTMVGDLQTNDAGIKSTPVADTVIADGGLHCAYAGVRDLPSPKQRGAALVDYLMANSYRRQFAVRTRLVTPTHIEIECPAQAGTAICALWSAKDPSQSAKPRIAAPPSARTAPDICRGPVTVARTAKWVNKIWSPYYYGSPEWRLLWEAGRPRAEAIFGTLFSENGQRATVGITKWAGQARVSIVYAAALAVQNLFLLRTWWEEQAVRDALPSDVRARLESEPLLWPTEALSALLPELLHLPSGTRSSR